MQQAAQDLAKVAEGPRELLLLKSGSQQRAPARGRWKGLPVGAIVVRSPFARNRLGQR